MTILRFDYQLFLLKESLYDYIGLLSSIFINISLVIWQMLSKTRWKICPMEKMALCSKTNCFQNLSVIEKCVQWSFSFDTIKLSKKKQTFYHVLQKKTAFCCYFEKQQFHSRQSNVGVNLSIIFLRSFHQLTRNQQNRAFPILWSTLYFICIYISIVFYFINLELIQFLQWNLTSKWYLRKEYFILKYFTPVGFYIASCML